MQAHTRGRAGSGGGLGTATTDPTALEGATRLRTVLPGLVSLHGQPVRTLRPSSPWASTTLPVREAGSQPVSLDAGCQFAQGDGFPGFNVQDSQARSLAL